MEKKVEYLELDKGKITMIRYKDGQIWDIYEGKPEFIIMLISLFTKQMGGLLNF